MTTTCNRCNQKVLDVYGPHTDFECRLNTFQGEVDANQRRWTPFDSDMGQLLASDFKPSIGVFEYTNSNGKLTGVFVSKVVLEGIGMYHTMKIDDMTLPEFLDVFGAQ